jgi:hypothetical protein
VRAQIARTLLLLGVAGALSGPSAVIAQVVERVGSSDVSVDRRLSRLLAGDPLVVARDTTLTPSDTVPRSVLVLDATLIHEGTILGDLVIVDAGAFVRPGSMVRGDLVNVAGGLYRSELSVVHGRIVDLAAARYRVVREEGRLIIEAGAAESPLTLDGFRGVHIPTYDRVNGLTLAVGASYRLPRIGDVTSRIHAEAGWQTERGEPLYAASLATRWDAFVLSGGHERRWATNERWIRGDLNNSISYTWGGRDYRDYHEVERSWVDLAREIGDEAKSLFAIVGLRAQIEDATTLEGGDPWHVFGDSARPNRVIDDGRTSSLVGHVDVTWTGQTTAFQGGVEYEAARTWEGGAFDFDRLRVRGEWEMQALADHMLEVELFYQQPLRGDTLPRQRWSFVGGSGTLQTAEFAEFLGDHVAHVETKYVIPFPERVAVPVLGAPDLQLIHAAGMAWLEGDDAGLRQEVGARLQFFGFYLRYMLEPSDPDNADLDIGVSWPF